MTIAEDIDFVKKLLPETYKVEESKTKGSIHCVSPIGIRKQPYINSAGNRITDDEDDDCWNRIMQSFKQGFAQRFLEVFHNTCFCHVDFTIYLKS